MDRLTFFTANSDVFLKPIILGCRDHFKVKSFFKGQEDEYYQLYGDTDIAWFEWDDQFTVEMLKNPSKDVKHIVRLHSYEYFTDFPARTNWNIVDKVIFVSEKLKQMNIEKFKIPPSICEVINNGVNMSKYTIDPNKKYSKKIAWIGYINYKKGADMLLHFWDALYREDPKIEFHIAGEFQDERLFLYFNEMKKHLPFKIHMDGWVNDIPSYLRDKDFVMSTSIFESFQYSIAEGMASGCIPLIHAWTGSNELYPSKYIFANIPQLIEKFKSFDSLPDEDKETERKFARDFISKHYDFEDKLKETINLIKSL